MINITHEKNEDLFLRLQAESIDIICIDPPYKYLKNQKLEVDFDEKLFFDNCKKVLTKDGFIIMFGRGVSFYRWNCILNDLGFVFKEEIIWDKSYGSSPLMAITRVHETISILSKGNGIIVKNKIPYIESKSGDLSSLKTDLNRLKTAFGNPIHFEALEKFFSEGEISFDGEYNSSTTITSGRKRVNRCVSTAQTIGNGMNEKSIIKVQREHYNSIHPTQKPVRLLERLLQLCFPKKNEIVVADFFGGSMSTMEAVINLSKTYPEIEFDGISCEMEKEYFDLGKQRIDKLIPNNSEWDNDLDF